MTTTPKRGIGQAGITLIELTIAAFIAGMLSLVMSTMIKSYTRATKVSEERMKSVGESLLGTRAIWHDVRQAGISFNMLNDLDGDEAGRKFYDYLPDSPCVKVASDPGKCKRTFTVSSTNNKGFVMAMTADGLMAPTPIMPASFYTQTAGATPSTPSTIEMEPEDLTDALDAVDVVGKADATKKMSNAGTLLRFYSPFFQRPVVGGSPNMSEAPRMLSFVGIAASKGVNPLPAAAMTELGIGVQRRADMAPSMSGSAVDNIDTFFKALPPVGGLSAFAMVVPVKFVRYQIRTITHEGLPKPALFRDVHNGTAFSTTTTDGSRMISMPVLSLTFTRDDITVPSIRPTISIDRRSYRQIMNIKDTPTSP